MAINIPYSVASNAKEFLAGMAAEQASYYKDKAKAAIDVLNFVSSVDSDLRSVYDKYIPNVHVVDVESFTNIIANRLTLNPERFLDENANASIAFNFGDRNSKEYLGLYKVISNSLKVYHANLIAQQGSVTNPVLELNKLSERLFNRTRKLDNAVSARVLGAEFSSRINKVFGNKAVLAAIDPKLGSSDTRYVFFSSSFNSITAAMRKEVYKNIQEYLKEVLGPDMLSGFAVGSIVNTGHAALISDVDSFVNTPAFASIIYGVGSGRSARLPASQISQAAELFKTESRILDNNIKVDKTFTSSSAGYGVLLSLGVTFTNIEDAELNGFRGSKYEKVAVNSFKIQKPATLTRSEAANIQKMLLRLVFRNNPALAKSSRNIVEFLRDALLGELTGKKTKSERTSNTLRNVKKVSVTKTIDAKPKAAKAVAVSSKQIALNKTQKPSFSLTNLLVILNSQLQDVVSANMGDGNSRNVLNYRSGRFAESVQVERLSESRSGMITAFYTYMKNPYATFSQGGRQSSPASRDPKLLIAKSIRDIASQHVSNALRSVNV